MKTPFLSLLLVVLLGMDPARGDDVVRLSLEECLDRAAKNALPIREAGFGPPIASTRITEARGEFDHLLSFRASGGVVESPSASFFSGADTVREQTFTGGIGIEQKVRTGGVYRLGFDSNDLLTNSRFFNFRPLWTNRLVFEVRQPLLAGAGRRYNTADIRFAERNRNAALAEYEGMVERTLAATERAYWNVVFLLEDLEVKQQSIRTAEELLRVAQRRLDAGAGTRVEVVQAEAGLAERDRERIVAEQLLADAEDRLRSFVLPFAAGAMEEIRVLPTDRASLPGSTASPDLAELIRIAFDERWDVRAAGERLEATGIRVYTTKNELLPRLEVFGNIGYTGIEDDFPDATEPILRADYPGWEVGVSLTFPLGNRSAKARHRRAVLERSRAAADFETLKNLVVLEVRSAAREVETALRQIEASRTASIAARAQFEAEQELVRGEKSTNFQLLEVEEDLSRARSQELRALVGYRIATVGLQEAVGSYLEFRGFVPPPPDSAEGDRE